MKVHEQSDDTIFSAASPQKTPEPPRRQMLESGAVSAAALVLGLVAVACGSSNDSNNSPATGGAGGSPAAGGKGGSPAIGGIAGSPAAGGKGGSPGTAGSTAKGGAGGSSGAMGEAGAASVPDADIDPLNALLTAEYNAITAYTAGAGLIGNAKAADPLFALRDVITDVAVAIQAQHKLHAAALVDAIEGLSGTPVKEAEVAAKFTPPAGLVAVPTISNVLKFAASAERGAAVAYNQVLAGLEDAKLRFLASAIEGDESQHFIVLAALVLGLASPGPNLSATTAAKVVPEPFVSAVGTQPGLDKGVPDYFA